MCMYVEIREISVHTNTCNTYRYIQIHTKFTIHTHTCTYIEYTQYIQYIPYIHTYTYDTCDTCSYISDTYRYQAAGEGGLSFRKGSPRPASCRRAPPLRGAHSVPQLQSHCGPCKPQSHGPSLRQRRHSGRCHWSARQEQSACRSLRESCSHEASGQACCQSARAISTLERVDNLFAGMHRHAVCRNQHEIRT